MASWREAVEAVDPTFLAVLTVASVGGMFVGLRAKWALDAEHETRALRPEGWLHDRWCECDDCRWNRKGAR